MLFNSYIFIFVFAPLVIAVYFALNHFKLYKAGMAFLLGMSMWFYGYFNPWYLIVIISSILVNYFLYRKIKASRPKGDNRAGKPTDFRGDAKAESLRTKGSGKVFWLVGIIWNVGLLVWFKYMDFFISNVNLLFGGNIKLLHIALPLGISFFTFQQISFITDAYKGEVGEYGFLDYACFVAFFPQLIAGPIVTHDELVCQFSDTAKKRINVENINRGLYLFAIGLAKKVILADTFADAATHGFAISGQLNTRTAIITMLSYTLQLYFDFSGYCDMATGIAKMLNIDLPANFNSPYKAVNISDFWKRWHMTLTRFLTKYIYIPLGGSRKGKVRTLINVFVVFAISGFWHGADWTFVIWGIMHGIMMIIYRLGRKIWDKIPKLITWFFTFVFVNIAWVFFRADSLSQAWNVVKALFGFKFAAPDYVFYEVFRLVELRKVLSLANIEARFPHALIWIFMIVGLYFALIARNSTEKMKRFKPTVVRAIATVFLLAWSICSLSGLSEFLYFTF